MARFPVLYDTSLGLAYTQQFVPSSSQLLYCPSPQPVACSLYLWLCFFCLMFTILLYIYMHFVSSIYFISLHRNKIRVPCFQLFFLVFNPIFPTTNISCNYYNCPRKKREISPIRCLGNTWIIRLSAHYEWSFNKYLLCELKCSFARRVPTVQCRRV